MRAPPLVGVLLAVFITCLAVSNAQTIRYPVVSGFSFGEAYHTVAAMCLNGAVRLQWIAAGGGAVSVQPQLDWFVRKAGVQAQVIGGMLPAGTANTVVNADPVVATQFRAQLPAPATARAAIRRCFVPQPVSGKDPIAAYVNRVLPAAPGVKARYVLLWWRGGANEPFRNTLPADMDLLVREVLARKKGATPVLIGDVPGTYAVPAGAISMAGHHRLPQFSGVRVKYTSQLQMFDYMIRTGRVIGQIGWLSGGMDGAALLGMKTVQFMFQHKTRMQRWSGGGVHPVSVPNYATISCPRVGPGVPGLVVGPAQVKQALDFIGLTKY